MSRGSVAAGDRPRQHRSALTALSRSRAVPPLSSGVPPLLHGGASPLARRRLSCCWRPAQATSRFPRGPPWGRETRLRCHRRPGQYPHLGNLRTGYSVAFPEIRETRSLVSPETGIHSPWETYNFPCRGVKTPSPVSLTHCGTLAVHNLQS